MITLSLDMEQRMLAQKLLKGIFREHRLMPLSADEYSSTFAYLWREWLLSDTLSLEFAADCFNHARRWAIAAKVEGRMFAMITNTRIEFSVKTPAGVLVKVIADLNDGTRETLQSALALADTVGAVNAEPVVAKNGNGQSTGVREEHPISGIRVVWDEKGKRARLITPKWAKYGVAIYDEVLATVGFDLKANNPGDYSITGTAVVQMNADGNPSKVVEIIQK